MSDQGAAPEATFAVSAGSEGLKLIVHAGGRAIPIAIAPESAAELGLALIAGSAVCAPNNPRPETDTIIRSTPTLPVTAFRIGRIDASDAPILIADILGGAPIPLRLTKEMARQCGAALTRVGDDPS